MVTNNVDGNDGTKTAVYDNGAILTDNGDGSKTGVDGDGNYVSLHVPMKNNSSYDYSDGTGVLTGGAVYDDEGSETTFTKLSLHVSQADGNAVQIDVEGEHAGSGEVNGDSPSVTYTDSMGYEVTVTFAVTDGVAHADMRIFGDLSIEDTGERCTETITLIGDKVE